MFRNEIKYLITDFQRTVLQAEIDHILSRDSNVGINGTYSIRSIYFDDLSDSCYFENENGIDPREKYRIRIYNGNSGFIILECKRKENGKTTKKSCRLTQTQVNQLIRREPVSIEMPGQDVLKRLLYLRDIHGMNPVVMVDYRREPFVYPYGNVRVTFDDNISSSNRISSFFEETIVSRPVLPIGTSLMEVKFDDCLPGFIFQALQLEELNQINFSKYYLCRKCSLS